MKDIFVIYAALRKIVQSPTAKRTLVLALGMLIGRFSGFVREWTAAKQFGVSANADIFALAITFPELVYGMLSPLGISTILYPLLVAKARSSQDLFVLFNRAICKIGLLFFTGMFLYVTFAYRQDSYAHLALSLCLVAIFPNCISSIATSFLNYFGLMKMQSYTTLIFNLCVIIGLLCFQNIYLIVSIIILASLLRMFALIFELPKHVVLLNPVAKRQDLELPGTLFLTLGSGILLSIVSQALTLLNPFIDRLCASYGGVGSTALLSYSEKLCMLPAALFLTLVPYVIIPEIYKLSKNQEAAAFKAYYLQHIRYLFLAGILLMAIVFATSDKIALLAFSVAGLSLDSIDRISSSFSCYALMLPMLGPLSILTTVLLATNKKKILIKSTLEALVFKILSVLCVVLFFQSNEMIALTTASSIIFLTIRQYLMLKKYA